MLRILAVTLLVTLAVSWACVSAAESPIAAPALVVEAVPVPAADTSAAAVVEDDAWGVEGEERHAVSDCPSGFFGPVRRWWHCRAKPRLQASHWGYAEFFHERPFGTFVHDHLQRQVFQGLANQLVLYRYDFSDGPGLAAAQLNARGRERLRELARMSRETGLPITIERSRGNAGMDQGRRQAVLRELERQAIALSPEMVVVARPRAIGIDGEDAEIMFLNRLEQTRARGLGSVEETANESVESVTGTVGD